MDKTSVGDFLYRFDIAYSHKLAGRAATFRAVLREATHGKVKTIVETGCTRKQGNWDGDGQSTIILSEFAKWVRGSFATVDLNQEAVDLARKLCPTAAVTCGDSVEFLSKYSLEIDLLYLDSFDLDLSNSHPAALHCMFEFCAALPKLHAGSIVFIDDSPMTDMVVSGKGTYVAQYLKQLGVSPFTFGYQAAWIMP